MRLIFFALALLCVAAGILFGALNPQSIDIDFYWMTLSASLGTAFLLSALTGVVLGGTAVLVGIVWPLRRRLRRELRRHRDAPVVAAESRALAVADARDADRL